MEKLFINWLNGKRSYIVGTILYKQYGTDESLKKLFATGNTDYTAKILLQTIQQIVNNPESIPTKKDNIIAITDPMPDSKDSVLMALKDEWMPLYSEMNYKRHELDKYLDDETDSAYVKRAQLALDILTLEQQCMAIWAKRDHYVKYNVLPGKSTDDEIVVDPFQSAKRIENLKVYIRRYKNEMTKNKANARAAELLNQYTSELNKLTQLHG
jgi:hypothetical protein